MTFAGSKRALFTLVALSSTFLLVNFVLNRNDGGGTGAIVTMLNRITKVTQFRFPSLLNIGLSKSSENVTQTSGRNIVKDYVTLMPKEVTLRPGQLWVKYGAPLADRLDLYNYVIGQTRSDVIQNISASDSRLTLPIKASKVYIDTKSYLRELAVEKLTNSASRTIYLQYLGPPLNASWDSRQPEMSQNFLVGNYYEWQGSGELCNWLKNNHYDFLHSSPCISGQQQQQSNSSETSPNKASMQPYL